MIERERRRESERAKNKIHEEGEKTKGRKGGRRKLRPTPFMTAAAVAVVGTARSRLRSLSRDSAAIFVPSESIIISGS